MQARDALAQDLAAKVAVAEAEIAAASARSAAGGGNFKDKLLAALSALGE